MRWPRTRFRWVVRFGLLVWLVVCGSAGADIVTDWNEVFLQAVRNETTPPPLAARNLAILHAAIYDAVNAITRTHQPYHFKTVSVTNTSSEAAASSAAHQVAVALYPSRKPEFNALLTRSIASLPDDTAKTNGLLLGRQVTHAILAWRAKDGSSTTVPYIPSAEPGRWRRTPPLFRPPELPQWRFVTPFTMTNVTQFRPAGPPTLDSARYAEDVNEVKKLGAKNSTNRTPEQTQIAQFWSDFSYTVTPPGHWNDIARSIVLNRKMSLEENARLFALLNIAMADGAILCWDAKYKYDFWRPVTAIREAERDGNPDTEADGQWESLLATPPFPEYPSGHSTFSGAAAAVLACVFRTNEVRFEVRSDSLPGVVRNYNSFSKTAEEIGRSRIYGGIHFSSADRDGRKAGDALGRYVVENFLQPVNMGGTQ